MFCRVTRRPLVDPEASSAQVPPSERESVKKDTMEKLRRCWRGIRDNQVFYLSTTNVSNTHTPHTYTHTHTHWQRHTMLIERTKLWTSTPLKSAFRRTGVHSLTLTVSLPPRSLSPLSICL